MTWAERARLAERRYADGDARLSDEPDARQKQLVRMAMAAGAAGLAHRMDGREGEATAWLVRSAERYRESWAGAPPGSWGRAIGALKSRVLAGDPRGAADDARWTLSEGASSAESPIARYAAALAQLILGEEDDASRTAASLAAEPAGFPRGVADALAALAARDGVRYEGAARAVLGSFETRDAYLEDVPVADTVLVLEALAAQRGLAAGFESPLLPSSS